MLVLLIYLPTTSGTYEIIGQIDPGRSACSSRVVGVSRDSPHHFSFSGSVEARRPRCPSPTPPTPRKIPNGHERRGVRNPTRSSTSRVADAYPTLVEPTTRRPFTTRFRRIASLVSVNVAPLRPVSGEFYARTCGIDRYTRVRRFLPAMKFSLDYRGFGLRCFGSTTSGGG